METLTLQTVEHLSGTVVYKAHSTTAGLTPPTFASLRIASPIREAADVVTGEMILANVSFEFMDETGHFWRDFLSADKSEISLEVTVGATTEMLFWGEVIKESVDFGEHDLYVMQRRGSFDCVWKVVSLKDVAPQTVFDASFAAGDMIALTGWNQGNTSVPWVDGVVSTVARIMNVKRLLQRIMEQVNGNFDTGDVVTDDFAQDCRWYYDSVTYDWMDLYFWCGTQNSALLSHGWFQEEEWKARFASCYDMLGGVVKSLLAFPVFYYDYTYSRHRVRILSRGHSTSSTTPLTMGRVLSSNMNPDISRHLKVVGAHSGWSNAATGNRFGRRYLNCESDELTDEEPLVGADIDLEAYFLGNFGDSISDTGDGADTGTADRATLERLYAYTSGTTAYAMHLFYAWDYEAADWNGWGGVADYALPSIARSIRSRFNAKRRSYTRKYEGLGPVGGAIGDLHLLKNHDIVDEDSVTRHFYATEISRDIEQDTVEVKWEQI